MNDTIFFGISIIGGLAGWLTIFSTVIWPRIRSQPRPQLLQQLLVMHFFRYLGTTFLITGLVTNALPSGFAVPAAFGDLISLVLAYVAFLVLQRSNSRRPQLLPVWVFNVVGTVDLLLALVMGPLLIHHPGDFGVTYYIPTFYVPLLLTAHIYIFKVLARRSQE